MRGIIESIFGFKSLGTCHWTMKRKRFFFQFFPKITALLDSKTRFSFPFNKIIIVRHQTIIIIIFNLLLYHINLILISRTSKHYKNLHKFGFIQETPHTKRRRNLFNLNKIYVLRSKFSSRFLYYK